MISKIRINSLKQKKKAHRINNFRLTQIFHFHVKQLGKQGTNLSSQSLRVQILNMLWPRVHLKMAIASHFVELQLTTHLI